MTKDFFIYENKNKLGFKNTSKNVVIENKFDEVKEFIGFQTWVKNNNTWSFINTNQELLLKKQFSDLLYFEKDFSVVKDEKTNYLINNSDLSIKKIPYEVIGFNENILLVKENNNLFYLDCELNKINNSKYSNALTFIDGFAPVCINSKWGIINKFGKQIIDFKYNDMKQNGANLFKVQKDQETFFIDLHDNKYLETLIKKYKIWDYFSDDVITFEYKGKWGVMNDFFEILFYKKVDKIYPFEENYAVYLKDNKYGILSKRGKLVTGNIFEKVLWKDGSYFFVKKDNQCNYFSLEDKKLIY
ncbi:WG repeat-containing protein [Malacoplasma penetrans]|uniref:WG repeat-containing protein n=1 Tax=Malacoplasma penetrans TaxID=28227 RepID=UPI0010107131|nr:WG repeat-containing protein [Malacoplasma penetrans]RXY96636.1 WG repeat-containing protein [Malacoplasma penetrans]